MKTKKEIEQELEAFRQELVCIKERVEELRKQKEDIAKEETRLGARLKEINGYRQWNTFYPGLILKLELELKETAFPMYNDEYRIIKVTEKTIFLKRNGNEFDDLNRHNKETGQLGRSGSSYGAIDPKKALEIWDKHQS